MASNLTLPEDYKIVLIAPIAAANGVTYDIISCKNAHKVWFVVSHIGDVDTDLTLSLVESTDVAGSTTAAVAATFPVWYNKTVNTSGDTLTKVTTDAASYVINTTTAADRDQLVVIEWDPAKFSSGYDCIQLADAGGSASNNVTAFAIIQERYPQTTPPSAIID